MLGPKLLEPPISRMDIGFHMGIVGWALPKHMQDPCPWGILELGGL